MTPAAFLASMTPNPFTSKLIIKTQLNTDISYHTEHLNLNDTAGQPVLKEQWNTMSGEASHTINVYQLSRGVFIAGLRIGNEVVWMKLVK